MSEADAAALRERVRAVRSEVQHRLLQIRGLYQSCGSLPTDRRAAAGHLLQTAEHATMVLLAALDRQLERTAA